MFSKKLKQMLTLSILALVIAGCSALEEPVSSLEDGISKMSTLSVGSVYTTKRDLPSTDPEFLSLASGIDTVTMGTNFKIVEVSDARVFNEGYTLGFNSSAIWLGSILNASGLPESKFDEIVFDRAPYSYSISLKGNGQQVRGNVDGTRSAYEQSLSDLLTPDVKKAQPGSAEFSYETIYSEQDLKFKLGFGIGLDIAGVNAKLGGLFNFNNNKIKTRVLVKYTQVYYSATMDKPSRPGKMFTDGLLFSEFQSKVPSTVSPVYISSIKYGRMGYLSIESESAEDVTLAAIDASLSGFGQSGSVNMSSAQSNVMSSSTIKAVMVGGGLLNSSSITGGLSGFLQWISNAAGEQNITSGMPIAFEMSYLKNNYTAEIYKMNKQYTVIWLSTNTNGAVVDTNTVTATSFLISNAYSTSVGSTGGESITGGSISIVYQDKDGNIINSSTYSANPGLSVSTSHEINLDNPDNKIVITFNLSGTTFSSIYIPGGTPWNRSGSFTVYGAELIGNHYKYKDPYNYNGATFTIIPK